MTPPIPADDPRAPKYWKYETSGALKRAVMAYLNGKSMSDGAMADMRAYIWQWIDSPVWDMNPCASAESRAALVALRTSARAIRTRAELDAWLELALEQGMDPL